jgi:hypothetical protein
MAGIAGACLTGLGVIPDLLCSVDSTTKYNGSGGAVRSWEFFLIPMWLQ